MSNYVLRKAGLGFNETKAVAALKKSGQSLIDSIASKKINVKAKKTKIIDELAAGMIQQAEIEVEQVIRDDVMIKAFDTLRCECFRVEDRIGSVAASKKCPSDLEQAVCTIIWAADRLESSEMQTVKAMLSKKFGKEFTKKAINDEDGCVNPKVVEKLRYQHNAPPTILKEEYLVNIAKTANVDYRPSSLGVKVLPKTASLGNKPSSLSSETLAKRYISSARPPSSIQSSRSKRLGDSPPKRKDGPNDSQRKSRQQDINPVVIAYLTL